MKIKHGQVDNVERRKYCKECKEWVAYIHWPKHKEIPHLPTTADMDKVREGVKAFFVARPDANPTWHPIESAVEATWNPLQEKYSKLEAEYKTQERKLRFSERENNQLKRVITELGRALVTTYAEY